MVWERRSYDPRGGWDLDPIWLLGVLPYLTFSERPGELIGSLERREKMTRTWLEGLPGVSLWARAFRYNIS